MTRSRSSNSFIILGASIALAAIAVWLGDIAANAFDYAGGYLPFFVIAATFVIYIGLVLCAPFSLFESIVKRPDFGPVGIALGAAIGLLGAAYFFGLATEPLTRGAWTSPWALIWIVGILPVLAAAMHARHT